MSTQIETIRSEGVHLTSKSALWQFITKEDEKTAEEKAKEKLKKEQLVIH